MKKLEQMKKAHSQNTSPSRKTLDYVNYFKGYETKHSNYYLKIKNPCFNSVLMGHGECGKSYDHGTFAEQYR